jgi:hypothetical protein
MEKNELDTTDTNCNKKPLDELVSILLSFTPDQLREFLNDPVTVSILQPEGAAESVLQEVS